MKSFTSRRFREMYANLPGTFNSARTAPTNSSGANPSHPGLHFKKVDHDNLIYSARVGLGYRALGRMDGEDIVWFWIGPHSEYDKLL